MVFSKCKTHGFWLTLCGLTYADIDHIGHLGHFANLEHLGHLGHVEHLERLRHLGHALTGAFGLGLKHV